MPRTSPRKNDLAAIQARRAALKAELDDLDRQAKEAEEAARDAGRSVLLAALDRVKIAAMDKADARAIAKAIAAHDASAIALRLAELETEGPG
ncbi:hypothetical protein [Novosphingobium sp. KN65.2]|uniref:hypothetical protein n=1 Tax=Novosphingobium sp. KN65.2 TaxID=1478134 RepID=UPI0005DDA9B1|nr:hypothetical protein [Novosphingobium sp. KN65.2]CDO37973.1 hypothetical protein SPHV1_480001 [Novosphingobium sp. KN65.2]